MGESKIANAITKHFHSKNICLNGCTRIVFLVGRYAIKIPNFLYCHQHFLQGCYANWSERQFCLSFKKVEKTENFIWKVAYSYWCGWFGLFQIQARCEPLERDLTGCEIMFYNDVCGGDNKKENFGWYQGRLVCIDYI